MRRNKLSFKLAAGEAGTIKNRMLEWSSLASILLFLDSNNYSDPLGQYDCLLAVGSKHSLVGNNESLLPTLEQWHNSHPDWLFGHISYDYKNVLEPQLHSTNPEQKGFPHFHFFVPNTVCTINSAQDTLTIETFDDPQTIYQQIANTPLAAATTLPLLQFLPSMLQQEYITTIDRLRAHIAAGDCYEINYCTAGHCMAPSADPLAIFRKLNALSPAPFAAYYRYQHQYLMCASPERYLQKTGNTVHSQPIKGTARRGTTPELDLAASTQLQNDPKERAENIMIVDLVRNDLARCCANGSITVPELFGIHTYPQVHQLVSTVSGTLKPGATFADAIACSFPMGSMTGAPKHKVMQLIDQYEQVARGIYSGTVGYITPDGDMDLNVVIRSLFYNSSTHQLSYQAGGAITYDSIPEKEWEELRLKAWAMERLFSGETKE